MVLTFGVFHMTTSGNTIERQLVASIVFGKPGDNARHPRLGTAHLDPGPQGVGGGGGRDGAESSLLSCNRSDEAITRWQSLRRYFDKIPRIRMQFPCFGEWWSGAPIVVASRRACRIAHQCCCVVREGTHSSNYRKAAYS